MIVPGTVIRVNIIIKGLGQVRGGGLRCDCRIEPKHPGPYIRGFNETFQRRIVRVSQKET